MQKKFLAGTILSVSLLLVGCSSGSKNVATMKGKTITQDDYYTALKESSTGKQTLQNLVLADALEQKYGSKVKKSEIDKQYKNLEDQYGSSLPSMLKQSGYTESSYKKVLRNGLLATAALKDKQPTSSKKFKDALDSAWKNYTPKITVQHILVDDENTAKDLIKKYEEDPTEKNFSKLAKENSKDTSSKNNGGKIDPFDPKSSNLDSGFTAAAAKLNKEGDYTKEPVKYQTGNGYFIIRLIKKPAKGTLAEHKKELTDQVYTQWQKDTTVMNPIYGKVLKDVDAKIVDKDKDLKDVLSAFYQTQTPTQQQGATQQGSSNK
ncbi:peptidylprolyl isomerase [Xylocopilactobacillus apicola]|uniref:Foldase protein PrsA n=1 Tax=Xylocopilactobacillus apicola TaxID=2932184 RepID=A0AAU9D852_9LACO|nr:peptidylprolyl isomerase [Xylocopilactobacillus apicola]BDR58505.1 foldase protein PrsA [Xylocopilactobacillus apicola]